MFTHLRSPGFLRACILLSIAFGVSDAAAHLMHVRQGAESTGVLEAGDRHGAAHAAGDFNGDGIDDLAVGAPAEDFSGDVDAGVVTIVYGNGNGLDRAGAVTLTEGVFTDGTGTAGGDFGHALAAGDFNGDGIDDLAIGSPGFDFPGANAGAVYLFRGTSSGLTSWFDLDQSDGGAAREAGDRFGSSLAVGDFDGNGFDDLAVGSPGENSGQGAIFWFLGTSIGLFGGSGHYTQDDFGQTPRNGDGFGTTIATGNFISTANDDLAASAPFRNVAGNEDAGVVYQIPGAASGLAVGGYGVLSSVTAPGFQQGNAFYGLGLAVGRFRSTSGGHESLAVGEPSWNGAANNSGRVLVYAGGTSGVITTTEIQLTSADAGGVIEGGEEFGDFLAAGSFWNDDGWDDLAVASTNEGFGFTAGAGAISIFQGGFNGPGSHGWSGFNAGTLNWPLQGGAELGTAPVFGEFDRTGNGHLVVGSPGHGGDAGVSHVIAPWRQVYGLESRQAVAYDCLDDPIFSVRPYDQVLIASTTKIMTVLIGVERIQAGLIDPNDTYIVPQWVATQIGGSQVPLATGERVNFWDMLNLCLHLSGNDAAHALADWMIGGSGGGDPAVTVGLFVQEMNQRAQQIGMTGTQFNNPNGFEVEIVTDLGLSHYSTPHDMALLSQVAMANPMFEQISNTVTYSWTRELAVPGGIFLPVPSQFTTFFAGIIQSTIQPATGIKGGWTPAADITGCFSGNDGSNGRTWVAGTYGTIDTDDDNFGLDAANVLALGGNALSCNINFDLIEATSGFLPVFDNVSAARGQRFSALNDAGFAEAGNLELFVQPRASSGAVLADLKVKHLVEVTLEPGAEIPLGLTPFDGHQGMTLLNTTGRETVQVEVIQPGVADDQTVELVPGEPVSLPAVIPARQLPGYELFLMNTSSVPAHVTVEIDYHAPVEAAEGDTDPRGWTLVRSPQQAMRDNLLIDVEGASDADDARLSFSLRPEGSRATSVGEVLPAGESEGAFVRLRPAVPNPVGGHATRIAFDLYQPVAVQVGVYDVRGRLVRDLGLRELLPGRHVLDWDTRDAAGVPVSTGVYFYRVQAAGQPATGGKLVVVR